MEKCPIAEEILGLDEPLPPNIDTVQFKLMLDFSIAVFVRLEELGLKQKDLAELLNDLTSSCFKDALTYRKYFAPNNGKSCCCTWMRI